MPHTLLRMALCAGCALSAANAVADTPSAPQPASSDAISAQLAALQAEVAALQQQAQSAPAASAASSTRIGGTMYGDVTHIDQTVNGTSVDPSGNGMDLKRFYLSVDHTLDTVWSANLTTDFNYVANDKETQLFVKKAYVQGKFSPWATLRVGAANMPWIPFAEDWYGYRFIDNTLIDRLKFGNSSDWGVHVLGDNGVFNYQVSAVNGGGYKNPSRSAHTDVAARVGVQPIKGLMLALGTYTGDLGQGQVATPVRHDARRYDALVAWNRNGLRLGTEWFKADNWQQVTTSATDTASGWSTWGSYDFKPLSVFARYDRTKPSQALSPQDENTYWNAGVALPVTQGFRVALAYKDGRDLKGGNLTRSHEIGAWGELKW